MVPEIEVQLGTAVQQAKQRLQELVGDSKGFEDRARAIVDVEVRTDWEQVKTALDQYQEAINRFWIVLYTARVPEYLTRKWRLQYRYLARQIPSEDIVAEVIFRMRDVLRDFDPSRGMPYRTFFLRFAFQALSEWAASWIAGAKVPREVLRETPGGGQRAASIDAEPGLYETAAAGTEAPVARRRCDTSNPRNRPDGIWRVGGAHTHTEGGVLCL